MHTIDELEDASTAACTARDKAVAHRDALLAVVAAFQALEAACEDSALSDVERQGLATMTAPLTTPWTATLKSVRLANEEIGRLEAACHEAAHALNSAPEESEAA